MEDDAEIAAVLKLGLQQQGYSVHVAYSVAEAQNYLQGDPVDLVITDWLLGDGTGGQVCAMVRANRRFIPLIVMSAVMSDKSQAVIDCKPDVFLIKPMRLSHLLMHVGVLLEETK